MPLARRPCISVPKMRGILAMFSLIERGSTLMVISMVSTIMLAMLVFFMVSMVVVHRYKKNNH